MTKEEREDLIVKHAAMASFVCKELKASGVVMVFPSGHPVPVVVEFPNLGSPEDVYNMAMATLEKAINKMKSGSKAYAITGEPPITH